MDWYYINSNQQIGPVSDLEIQGLIRSGQINRNTPVWNENMKDWLPAEGTQLATLFNQPPQYTPPRLPPNQPNNPEVYRSQSQGQSQENKLPTGVIIGIVLLVIGAIGWASDSFTAAQARPFLVIGVFLILGMLTLGKGK